MRRLYGKQESMSDEEIQGLPLIKRLNAKARKRIMTNPTASKAMAQIQKRPVRYSILAFISLFVLFVGYMYNPYFHLLYTVIRGSPILAFIALPILVFYLAIKRWPPDSMAGLAKRIVLVVMLCLPLLAYLILMGPYTGVAVLQEINATTLDNWTPTTDIRYVALDVGEAVGSAMMGDSRYNAGDIDPFDYRGKLSYSVPRIPNGLFNRYFGTANGIMLIETNATEKKPDTRIIAQEFKYGEGMGWFSQNRVYYQLYAKHFWCEIPEIYYVFAGDELVEMAPYLEYRFEWHGLVFVPRWAGVFVIHGDGKIEQLSKEEALADARFAKQRLFPERMARKIADSWQYQNGIWNTFTTLKDVAIVDDPTNSDNIMPYLMPTDRGDAWVVIYKPASSNTDSVSKIQFIDARTGQIRTLDVSGRNWIGPNKAVSLVTNLHRNWDRTKFEPVEAQPVFTKTQMLYWQISTISKETKLALVETVLSNAADTQNMYIFDSYQSIKLFLDSGIYKPAEESQTLDVSKMDLKQLGSLLGEISQSLTNQTATAS